MTRAPVDTKHTRITAQGLFELTAFLLVVKVNAWTLENSATLVFAEIALAVFQPSNKSVQVPAKTAKTNATLSESADLFVGIRKRLLIRAPVVVVVVKTYRMIQFYEMLLIGADGYQCRSTTSAWTWYPHVCSKWVCLRFASQACFLAPHQTRIVSHSMCLLLKPLTSSNT